MNVEYTFRFMSSYNNVIGSSCILFLTYNKAVTFDWIKTVSLSPTGYYLTMNIRQVPHIPDEAAKPLFPNHCEHKKKICDL